jgi:hypothetical protein
MYGQTLSQKEQKKKNRKEKSIYLKIEKPKFQEINDYLT